MNQISQSQPEGILLVDKPAGCTSHDVVGRLRRLLKIKKIGHAGTLDPNATGLLIMLIGRATKVSQYLMSLDKVYQGVMRMGIETNTYDCEGEVTAEYPVPALDRASLEEIFAGFIGDQYQMPPMFSAKKVDGVPLYKHARKGREIEREPRFIRISKLTVGDISPPDVQFEVHTGKGVYVRTLVFDIGRKLGCGAHLLELRRLGCGRFTLDQAYTLDALEAMGAQDVRRRLIPVYQAVPSHVIG